MFQDDSRKITPAIGKLKTKLNDLSNALLKCTNFYVYEFLPIFLVCGTEKINNLTVSTGTMEESQQVSTTSPAKEMNLFIQVKILFLLTYKNFLEI